MEAPCRHGRRYAYGCVSSDTSLLWNIRSNKRPTRTVSSIVAEISGSENHCPAPCTNNLFIHLANIFDDWLTMSSHASLIILFPELAIAPRCKVVYLGLQEGRENGQESQLNLALLQKSLTWNIWELSKALSPISGNYLPVNTNPSPFLPPTVSPAETLNLGVKLPKSSSETRDLALSRFSSLLSPPGTGFLTLPLNFISMTKPSSFLVEDDLKEPLNFAIWVELKDYLSSPVVFFFKPFFSPLGSLWHKISCRTLMSKRDNLNLYHCWKVTIRGLLKHQSFSEYKVKCTDFMSMIYFNRRGNPDDRVGWQPEGGSSTAFPRLL